MTHHQIEYVAWLVLQVYSLGQYTYHYWTAFLLSLGLQVLRKRLDARWYRILWQILLPIALGWGGWALLRYLYNWPDWYEAWFFLPCVLASVGLARLQERLRGRLYWPMLGAIVIVIASAYWVMAPYRTPEMQNMKANPWNRPHVTAEIRHYLTGKGWGGWTRNGDIRWLLLESWGVVLLVSVAAVRPRKEAAVRSSEE